MNQLSDIAADDLIALLKADVASEQKQLHKINALDRDKAHVSYAQQRLWFLQQYNPQDTSYNQVRILKLNGPLNAAAIESALQKVVDRHAILRTGFVEEEDGLFQVVDKDFRFSLHKADFSDMREEQRQESINAACDYESTTSFDLSRPGQIRGQLLKVSEQLHILIITTHHIVSDAESNSILVADLSEAYRIATGDTPQDKLPALPVQYADYAEWQYAEFKDNLLADNLNYWREYLGEDIPVLQLPTDFPRSSSQGNIAGQASLRLSKKLSASIYRLAANYRATPLAIIMAAWQALLYRYSGQTEFGVGVPNANRNLDEIQGAVGCFMESQVFKARVDPFDTAEDLIVRLREEIKSALEYELPFELLLDSLKIERSVDHPPLFQTLIDWKVDGSGTDKLVLEDLSIEIGEPKVVFAKYDLSLHMFGARGQQLGGVIEFNRSVFKQETIERLAQHWQRLLGAMVKNPLQRVSALPLLSDAETHRILREWNDTAVDYEIGTCVHSLFESQVEKIPKAIALIFPQEGAEQRLTYAELNSRANRLAHRLRSLGVGPDVLVGIAVERSVDMVVGLLGILKAGGAYVPLDPDYPPERLSYMMTDSGIDLLLTQERLQERLPIPQGVQVLKLDGQSEADWQQEADENLPLITLPGNLAYVIYTSGSTGKPKGTLLVHRNVSRLMQATEQWFHFDNKDVWTLFHSYAFDFSVWEMFGALLYGGKLLIVPRDIIRATDDFYRLLCDYKVTVLNQTPSAFRQLMGFACERADLGERDLALRHVIFGGEALAVETLQPWFARFGDQTPQLTNMYGITETTVHVTYRPLSEQDQQGSPIGERIRDLSWYVLDGEGQPVAPGCSGELHVGRAGLARGYLDRAGLTAERFVPDPYDEQGGGRLYRTGDLARYRSDGNIEYAGRIDHQVKIRGFRIELGEIESHLQAQAEVRDAVVIAQSGAGGQQLVAYVVPVESDVVEADAQTQTTFRSELKSRLQTVLPEYMVPNQYVLLDKLLLTPNGKLDRKALSAVEGSAFQRVYEVPRTELEHQLAEIWQAVLGVERVGLNDNFFELGGHSLLATQVVSRIRRSLTADLPLRALFETSDLRALAERVSQKENIQLAPIERVSRKQPLLLSYAQQRQWVLWQLEPESAAYHISAALHLKGALDVEALGNSFDVVIARHEMLRTHFVEQNGELCQVIVPALSLPLFPQVLEITEGETEEQALKCMLQAHASEPFNLAQGPLLRARLISLGDDDHVLSLVQHHIISDAWSLRLMVEELVTAYRAYSQGQSPVLPELPIQYVDYATWQRQIMEAGEAERQLSYWREQLGGEQPTLELPLDHPRPQQPSYRGASYTQMLPKDLSTRVSTEIKRAGVTPFMLLLASFQILLHRYSGQDDIRVGVPIANRTRLETERLIGLFVNTQVLRAEIGLTTTVNDLLQQTRQRALEAQAYQDLPFEQLVEALQPERSLNTTPLFQVMFNYLQVDQSGGSGRLLAQLEGLTVEGLAWEQRTAQFDLTLDVSSSPDGLFASFNYATDLFEHSTIERLAYHWQRLLAEMVRDSFQRIAEIPLLDSSMDGLYTQGGTSRVYPLECGYALLFEEQVERHSGEVVARCRKEEWTYSQLNQKANRLAHELIARDVLPDTPVALLAERGLPLLGMINGVFKAAAGYLPLDPAHPIKRLASVIESSATRILVCDKRSRLLAREICDLLPGNNQPEILVWEDIQKNQSQSGNPNLRVTGQHLAYVIYTSGSTGEPKGVMVEQAGMLNNQLSKIPYLELTESDVIAQTASQVFDISVWQFLTAGLCGARVEIVPDEVSRDPDALLNYVKETGITILESVPALISGMLNNASVEIPNLRYLLPTGEAMPPKLAQQWMERYPEIKLVNAYGPAECSDDVALHRVEFVDTQGTYLPIGEATDNNRLSVLDNSTLSMVPWGAIGELCIAGTGVGRGYLADPVRTAETFIPNEFAEQPGERLYRSGDLVRRRYPDRVIEYIGRIDHQVKIRGFRIELGEIESQLNAQAEVKEAVVIAQQVSEVGGQQLVAYVVPSDNTLVEDAVDTDVQNTFRNGMKAQLQIALPEYMVPHQYVLLDKLPLTPNGKLDRKALPKVDSSVFQRMYEAPQTELEQKLAGIWQEVLGVERVGRNDNFFELGGHSLLATQVVSRIRQTLKVDLSLRALFEAADLHSLSERIAAESPVQVIPIERISREQPLPLSYAQQRQWVLWQLEPESAAYHISAALRLQGILDVEALNKSFDAVIARHEVLRTHFTEQDGELCQVIVPHLLLPLAEEILIRTAEETEEAALQRILQHHAGEPFDLTTGPLLRVKLIHLSDNDHVLALVQHHIVSDDWSMRLMVDELVVAYQAYSQNQLPVLPELPIQYADYAVWQRQIMESGETERQLSYWRQQLSDEQLVLELPLDHPHPQQPSYRGASLPQILSSELVVRIERQARTTGVTPFMFLLASFQILLHRYSGQDDIRVGVPIANRTRLETERLIGFFVNTQVLRAQISPEATVNDLLQQVKRTALESQAHQDLPFEQLVEALRPERSLSYSPLFQVMFNYLQADQSGGSDRLLAQLEGLTVEGLAWEQQTAQFDLTLNVSSSAEGLAASFNYATDLFERSTIERLAHHWQRILEAMVNTPAQRISELSILSDTETHRILREWNATTVDYGEGSCIHSLFEAQVEQTPEAIALVFPQEGAERRLTYAELNSRANRLAHTLRKMDVGPDVLVGIAVERSVEMVIGLLGILKAGGAYVPLDPEYPAERLSYMMTDSGIRLLLTQTELQKTLPVPVDVKALCLDQIETWQQSDTGNLSLITNPQNLAYVIYTSGSTGKPKGTLLAHYNVSRLMQATEQWFHFDSKDVWTLFHSYAFDFSVWEMFGALLYGGKLVIVPREVARSTEDFYTLLCDYGVTVLNQTPSAFRQLMEVACSKPSDAMVLSHIIFGGEALAVESLWPWFERFGDTSPQLTNMYGITETTVHVTYRPLSASDKQGSPLGRPIDDLSWYMLDSEGQPVLPGCIGELYIGGAGLARGYLGRARLTAERFVPDPYGEQGGGRLYRTGDLARYRTDGNIEYVGRIDHQVKIRGFRIELGEIESQLLKQPEIKEAVVIDQYGPTGARLVGYVVTQSDQVIDSTELRKRLGESLPDYMVPSVIVAVEILPLTPHGKLDRKALPEPDFGSNKDYEAPQGEAEEKLAQIWSEVLAVDRVGRNDNFFELGGHSLLALKLVASMRSHGWSVPVRTLFRSPRLKDFAQAIAQSDNRPAIIIPLNGIPGGCKAIQPEMVTLVDLTPKEIAYIEAATPGGAANIQDIYPLAPLQEGILFHHLLQTEGDVYITSHTLRFDARERLTHFIKSFNQVIARHDILRTAVLWEHLKEPVQVVYRQAELPVQWLELDEESPAIIQLDSCTEFAHYRINVRQAPMLRLIGAYDAKQGCWLVKLLSHHLIDDNTTLQRVVNEIALIQKGQEQELPEPLPFRHFIAQSRMAVSDTNHQDFFTRMLGDVDEPTVPFNLQEVRGDGTEIDEAVLPLTKELALQVRQQAQKYGVSTAAIFHLAWALVVGKTSGRSDVVFGTVLLGRMLGGEGAERALGLFINTLPVRIQLGQQSVARSLQQTHRILSDLMDHEQASLGLAMRCSALSAGTPLFSALFNYRHTRQLENEAVSDTVEGIEILEGKERTNYPFGMSVNDDGNGFGLVAHVQADIGAGRICEMMHMATAHVAEALASKPNQSCCELELLSQAEQNQLRLWSASSQCYPDAEPVHCLFEAQVERTPDAVALIFPAQADQPEQMLTYTELNIKANQLAHRLRSLGMGPDVLVGIAVERSVEMVVAVLAILKAGGAYVPLDPAYPAERLAYMVSNSRLALLVTQKSINGKLPLSDDIQRVFLEDNRSNSSADNLSIPIHDKNLAYVIFTSGTTGLPKGVGIDQGSLARHTRVYANRLALTDTDCVLQYATLNFDTFGEQVFPSLCRGASVVVRGDEIWDHDTFYANLIHYRISVANLTPSLWLHLIKDFAMQGREDFGCLRRMIVGGEAMPPEALTIWQQLGLSQSAELWNFYGPTEATAAATSFCCNVFYEGNKSIPTTIPIGEPLQGRTVYIVSNDLNLLPSGVAGELVIGGELLARGYLGRAGLTAERFVPNPYDEQGGNRLYRTGDLARYRSDGNIEYVGRIDHQVKIRGFRIELGEIESQLQAQAGVRDAVVIAQLAAGGQQLVAYMVPSDSTLVDKVVDVDVQNAFRVDIKAQLQAVLPEYMVPNQYVLLDKLPLTPNGKLDRKALPVVDGSAFQRVYEEPRTELEHQLAEIWRSVLGVEQVGLNDNFFELGGDSIISIQLVSRARQKGIHFTPKDVFQYQTLASLTAVARQVEETVQIDQGLVKGSLQLTSIQQWFFEETILQRHHWNQSVLLKPSKLLQAAVLQTVLEHLLYHHDALRLSFTEEKAYRWQAIFLAPEQANKDLLWQVSVSGVEELEVLCDEAQQSLDLERGPLLRAVLADLPEGQRLLLVIHHLVVDGVSWRILLEDLQTVYRQVESGQTIQLPAKTSSVQVWSERLQQYVQGEALQQELTYWQTELAGVQGDLSRDNPEGSLQNKFAQSVTTHLDKAWTERLLKEAPAAYRTQINDLLLTALARVIARWAQQSSVLIQLEGHGREDLFEDIDLTRTVGWFTTVYPVRLSPSDSLDTSLKAIKEQLRAVPNKGIGFGLLCYLGDETTRRQLRELPQPRITFNYLGQFDSSFDTEKGLFSPADGPSGTAQNPEAPLGNWLSINGQVYNGELSLNWSFSSEMYAEATIQKLADAYAAELRTLIEYCCKKENYAVTPSDFPLVNLNQAQLDALPIPANEIEDIYPLSPMQQGMLFHSLSAPEEGAYVNQMRVDIHGLDVERFQQAWQDALDRHAILRAGFIWEGVDEPIQVIRSHRKMVFQELDWRSHPDLDEALASWAHSDRQKGFDFIKEPKLRLTVIRTGNNQHHLIYTNHHILMDGWSSSQLVGEVLQRYQGQIPATISGSYRDYLAWLQSRDTEESEHFWREQLTKLEEPTLLAYAVGNTICAQSIELNKTEAVWGDYTVTLTAEKTSRLSNFARQQKITVNTVLQAAWLLLLQRYTGQDCVTFGATVAGRPAEVSGIEQQLGLFINTLPVVGQIDPIESVGDWLQRVQAQNLALREHEHTPLYEIQRWAGQGGNALFDNIIVFENYPISEALKKGTPSGLVFGEVQNYEQTNYGLTLAVNVSDHLSLQCHYDRRQFSDVIVKQLGQQLICLLATFMQNINQTIGNLPLLNPSDTTYLHTPNRASKAYPLECGYALLFEEQVERHSGEVVARCRKEEWTYSQLNQKANRLAHELIARDVLPDTSVALLAERGLPFLGMINGVFKAAAGYLPLDPAHPIKRLASIIESSATQILVCDKQSRLLAQEVCSLLSGNNQPEILVWEDIQKNQSRSDNPNLKVTGQHLAYVIYTSGSTGEPKGVMVGQAGMLNNQLSKIPYLELTESDVIAQTASQVFDISVWQFLIAGLCGARVEIVPDEISRDPDALLKYVRETGITILESVPALISGMLAGAPVEISSLRYLLPTGEAMPPKLAQQWMERYPEIKLVNAYGPAECSDDVALHRVEFADTQGIYLPVGEATDNNRLFVLDNALSMMPWQATGELYIAGTGVGRGYLSDPVRTAEAFVPNEFAEQLGERLYRSGDLVRRRYPDGVIEYVGRIDHQVKIRGFRIELGEVESQLNAQAEVKEAVVVAQKMGETGGQQLVAYVVPIDYRLVSDNADLEAQNTFRAELKAQLQAVLPEYMVPAQYVLLDKLPLTPNGKLDRKALPAVDGSAFQRVYEAPRTELERQLAEIWQEILGVEQIGLNDNFFELGGHSLLAVKLLAEIRKQLQIESVGLLDILQAQTIGRLVKHINQSIPKELSPLVRLNQCDRNKKPLFCLHPVSVYPYYQLALKLRDERPVYGVMCGAYIDSNWFDKSWDSVVEDYLCYIRKIQPHGPYLLLGWSLGGLLAQDIASRLEFAGEKIHFLGLVDTTLVNDLQTLIRSGKEQLDLITDDYWGQSLSDYEKKSYYFIRAFFPELVDDNELKDMYLNREVHGEIFFVDYVLEWVSKKLGVSIDFLKVALDQAVVKKEIDLGSKILERFSRLVIEFNSCSYQVKPMCWWATREVDILKLEQTERQIIRFSNNGIERSIYLSASHERILYLSDFSDKIIEILKSFE